MSVQVSYKKQFVLGFLLLIIFFVVIEVFANIWLYYFYECDFEDNEIFKNMHSETKRKICLATVGLENANMKITMAEGTKPQQNREKNNSDNSIVFINSEGFRSPEFLKEKPENTYRIFVLGGSSTFGVGVLDNQTYPFFLQKLYDETNLGFNVEVFNTGWVSWSSTQETKLIKKSLVNYEPDLFIVYDGINDLNDQVIHKSPKHSPVQWKDRWLEICELGKQRDFDTLISLQPFVGTGNKILTVQESLSLSKVMNTNRLEPYPSYIKQLDELKTSCTSTADLRNIFDHYEGPIFFDVSHTSPKGNQIIAESFYTLSLPIVLQREKSLDINIDNEKEPQDLNHRLISNDDHSNVLIEKVYLKIRDLISYYKTPKVFPLIFN